MNTEENIKVAHGPVTVPVGDGRYSTQNTKEAVALATVGVGMANPFPITNIYTKDRPVSTTHPRALPGEPGWRPGVVSYHFKPEDEDGQPIKPLIEAYAANNADMAFDALLEKLDEKIREERHLDAELINIVDALKKTYRPSLIVHIRRAFENHKIVIDGIFKAEEWIKVRAGLGFKFIRKYASPAEKKAAGL